MSGARQRKQERDQKALLEAGRKARALSEQAVRSVEEALQTAQAAQRAAEVARSEAEAARVAGRSEAESARKEKEAAKNDLGVVLAVCVSTLDIVRSRLEAVIEKKPIQHAKTEPTMAALDGLHTSIVAAASKIQQRQDELMSENKAVGEAFKDAIRELEKAEGNEKLKRKVIIQARRITELETMLDRITNPPKKPSSATSLITAMASAMAAPTAADDEK